jgi:hypothetical protein
MVGEKEKNILVNDFLTLLGTQTIFIYLCICTYYLNIITSLIESGQAMATTTIELSKFHSLPFFSHSQTCIQSVVLYT